ncbi:MAG: alpha/beta fold hydrolase [Paracoccaceae bacterium]
MDYDIVIKRSTLRSVLHDGSHADLTDAEFRLALSVLQGFDLKQAARADGTGYETKRSQFKSLSGKLGLSGQSEVVRTLTIRMMQGLTHLAQPKSRVELDSYAATYFPPQVRRLNIISSDGHIVPVIEYGPVIGTPLIVLHPMFFPPIGPQEIAQAEELGVRLIWPLRPGLLDPEAPILSSSTHLAVSKNGLLAVLDQLVGQSAPVLAFVSSGAVATRAAMERPDLVQSISFIATCYSSGRSSFSTPYFGAELAELALRNEAIMTRTAAALSKYVSSDQRFRRMFENIFRGSPRDSEHVVTEFDGPDKGERLRSVTLKSPESIKQDFFNQTQFRWSEVSDLNIPRRFYHGADDSIHPPDKFEKILRDLGEPLPVIDPRMGHLPHFSDLRQSIDFAVSWQIHSAK